MTLLEKARKNFNGTNQRTIIRQDEKKLVTAYLRNEIRMTDLVTAIGKKPTQPSYGYNLVAIAAKAMHASGELVIKLK